MSGNTAEELLRQLTQRHAEATAESLSRFDARVLCRLTLFPEWTTELVGRLGVADPAEAPALVDQLTRADLIDQRVVPGADSQGSAFWVRTRWRREIGDHVRDRLGTKMFDEYHALCDRVGELDRADLKPWLQVADYVSDSSGRLLLNRVESLLRMQELPMAATTIATARVVAEVLGGSLEDSVTRAQWRMEREYRTKNDLEQLRGYQPRTGIEQAVADLVTGRDQRWALHLLGDAGVGKTMAVRHLAAGRLADKLDLPRFPVARVDFDHLDPRYPEQRPAELLVAMTDELLGFAADRNAAHRRRVVHDAADALHEELSRTHPDLAVVSRLRRSAIQRFADFLKRLPRPVVLVLDTCEELGKLYAPGASAPAIDRTFDLLEDLHATAPQVRVLLAGRRPLVPPTEDDRLYAGPRLLARDYVRVEPVRGFTAPEAQAFMNERDVPARAHAEILRHTKEPGGDHNPFELAGLCDWARDEPDLDLRDLARTTVDPYVERRILARVHNRTVRAALPFAVALGAFDRALLAPALTRAGIDVEAAFDGLSAQEWVTVRALGRDGRAQVIEIDEHLRERLRAALGRSAGHPAPDLLALGRDATELIDSVPLTEVATETVAAAVRLLPPEEAGNLWTRIDARVLRDHAWGWALQVTPRVAAAEQERAGDTEPTILAAILATEASARLHSGHREGMPHLWSAVGASAPRHPHRELVARLFDRVWLGMAATGWPEDMPGYLNALLELRLSGVEYPPDAMIAALENMVPVMTAAEDRQAARIVLDRLSGPKHPVWIRAGAAVLLAGLYLRGFREPPVAGRLDSVLRELPADAVDALPVYPDWVVADCLVERVRLARVLVALHGGDLIGENDLRAWRAASGDSIDGDRLRAALLDLELSFVPEVDVPDTPPEPPAGTAVPWLHHGYGRPLAVVIADTMAVRGDYEQAESTLLAYRRAAVAEGDSPEDIEACDLALLRLCRLTGSTRYAPVNQLAYQGTPRLRDEAWLVLRLTDEADDVDLPMHCSLFGRWRCAPVGPPPPGSPHKWAADHLDLWEAQRLRSPREEPEFPVHSALAPARSALQAGEILAALGHRRRDAEPLLRQAENLFSAMGDERGATRARKLLVPTAAAEAGPRPGLRARITALWEKIVTYTIAVTLILRRAGRSWTAVRTPGEIGIRVFGAAAVTAPYGAFLLVLDPFFTWRDVVALTGLALVGFVASGVSAFELRRLAVVRKDGALSITCYRSRRWRLPWPSGTRFRTPMKQRLRTTDHPLRDGVLPDALPIIAPDTSRKFSADILVVFLDLPHELHELGAWEQSLGVDVRRKRLAQVVWARRFPGPPTRITDDDWRERDEAFAGPVRFRPRRELATGTAGHRLVHVLGTPVPTSAGWQMRVRDTTGTSARQSSRGAGRREELVDLQELARDPLALLVLQAEPVDGPPQPLGSERDGFVAAATAAMDSGADAVLVVPPLPDALAEETISLIWRNVSILPISATWVMTRVIRIAVRLKTLIVKAGAGEQNSAACLDVLVFQRSLDHPKDVS